MAEKTTDLPKGWRRDITVRDIVWSWGSGDLSSLEVVFPRNKRAKSREYGILLNVRGSLNYKTADTPEELKEKLSQIPGADGEKRRILNQLEIIENYRKEQESK